MLLETILEFEKTELVKNLGERQKKKLLLAVMTEQEEWFCARELREQSWNFLDEEQQNRMDTEFFRAENKLNHDPMLKKINGEIENCIGRLNFLSICLYMKQKGYLSRGQEIAAYPENILRRAGILLQIFPDGEERQFTDILQQYISFPQLFPPEAKKELFLQTISMAKKLMDKIAEYAELQFRQDRIFEFRESLNYSKRLLSPEMPTVYDIFHEKEKWMEECSVVAGQLGQYQLFRLLFGQEGAEKQKAGES